MNRALSVPHQRGRYEQALIKLLLISLGQLLYGHVKFTATRARARQQIFSEFARFPFIHVYIVSFAFIVRRLARPVDCYVCFIAAALASCAAREYFRRVGLRMEGREVGHFWCAEDARIAKIREP